MYMYHFALFSVRVPIRVQLFVLTAHVPFCSRLVHVSSFSVCGTVLVPMSVVIAAPCAVFVGFADVQLWLASWT